MSMYRMCHTCQMGINACLSEVTANKDAIEEFQNYRQFSRQQLALVSMNTWLGFNEAKAQDQFIEQIRQWCQPTSKIQMIGHNVHQNAQWFVEQRGTHYQKVTPALVASIFSGPQLTCDQVKLADRVIELLLSDGSAKGQRMSKREWWIYKLDLPKLRYALQNFSSMDHLLK